MFRISVVIPDTKVYVARFLCLKFRLLACWPPDVVDHGVAFGFMLQALCVINLIFGRIVQLGANDTCTNGV